MDEKSQLTDSEIGAFRAEQREKDHWRWLRTLVRRSVLWTVAVVAGGHALIEKIEDLWKWLQTK